MEIVSSILIGLGLIFWYWGTAWLIAPRSVLFKLHNLSVADTLGSLLIMAGLLFLRSREWPLLVLGIITLVLWNTMLGYVLAHCASRSQIAPNFSRSQRVEKGVESG